MKKHIGGREELEALFTVLQYASVSNWADAAQGKRLKARQRAAHLRLLYRSSESHGSQWRRKDRICAHTL
jgi:hypothetical protein